MAKSIANLLVEAKRRRVFRTTGVYIVAVWGLSQGAAELGPLFGAPEWLVRALVMGAVALLPVVVVLSWMFDVGRSGIVRDPQTVPALQAIESDIESMSTISTLVVPDTRPGAVIVHWNDEGHENAAIFAEEFFLGRANDCRVRFYDPLISRKHARVYCEEDQWRIEDLGSRNGTLVNGEQVVRSILPKQCEVQVSEAAPLLRFELVPPGAEMQSAMSAFPAGKMIAHVRQPPSGFGR